MGRFEIKKEHLMDGVWNNYKRYIGPEYNIRVVV